MKRDKPPAAVLRAIAQGQTGLIDTSARNPREVVHEPFGRHHVALVDVCVRCLVLRG
jgi:hypothetical protein